MHTSPLSRLALLALLGLPVACGGPTPPPKAPATEAANVATTAAPAPSSPSPSTSSSSPSSSPPASPTTPAAPASDAKAAPGAAPVAASKPAARPSKISARHVLIQWMGCQSTSASVVRTREQARVLAMDVLRRAKAGEDFARLAVDFSDEPNAGSRGGSLGRFGHGAMVKEFEDAAFALEPGEISGIVESPFGFHVIQRTE